MTQQDAAAHWLEGAKSALRVAKLTFEAGEYEHVLFNCHLSIEKLLKSLYIQTHNSFPPKTHDLSYLSELLSLHISSEQQELLNRMNRFVSEARYSDPLWKERHATKEYTTQWLEHTNTLFKSFSDA